MLTVTIKLKTASTTCPSIVLKLCYYIKWYYKKAPTDCSGNKENKVVYEKAFLSDTKHRITKLVQTVNKCFFLSYKNFFFPLTLN